MFSAGPCAGCWVTDMNKARSWPPKEHEACGKSVKYSDILFPLLHVTAETGTLATWKELGRASTGTLCTSPWRTSWSTAGREGAGSLLGHGSCVCERTEKWEGSGERSVVGVEYWERHEARKLRSYFISFFEHVLYT